MSTPIAVYADWNGLSEPLRLGTLIARRSGGREVFEFEFDDVALSAPAISNVQLDPRLGLFNGRQYPPRGRDTFGVFVPTVGDVS